MDKLYEKIVIKEKRYGSVKITKGVFEQNLSLILKEFFSQFFVLDVNILNNELFEFIGICPLFEKNKKITNELKEYILLFEDGNISAKRINYEKKRNINSTNEVLIEARKLGKSNIRNMLNQLFIEEMNEQ